MKDWKTIPSMAVIEKTIKALESNGIEASVAANAAEAAKMIQALIPAGSEILTAGSVTLDALGLAKEFNESGKYESVKGKFSKMDAKVQGREMRKMGAGPDIALGSAHAVTETGSILFASFTGSQLPAYAYGAGTVIWVVGAQKIVKDVDEGFKRIWDYVLGLESARARKAYNMPDTFSSYPSKILVFNRELQPGRAKLIIVNEPLGF
jgi:acyl-CoA hydrolase